MTGTQSYRPPVRRSARTKTVVALSIAAVVVASFIVWLVVRFASANPDDANLGASVFRFQAERLARNIERDGPFLLKDPLNRGREVYVQHVGDSPDEGWTAIRAYAGEADLRCILRWERDERRFVDPCTQRSYPPDGAGLEVYPAEVRGRAVEVDLRRSARS